MKEILFKVALPVSIKKKGTIVVACCPVLDVWSQGNTEVEAKKNIEEALKMFLLTCFEKGTLDAALKECGFKFSKATIKKPITNKFSKNCQIVDIPIPFSVPTQALCHA